jgi:hypothetical protein
MFSGVLTTSRKAAMTIEIKIETEGESEGKILTSLVQRLSGMNYETRITNAAPNSERREHSGARTGHNEARKPSVQPLGDALASFTGNRFVWPLRQRRNRDLLLPSE